MRLIYSYLLIYALLASTAIAQDETQEPRSWIAPNNWEVVYGKGLGIGKAWGCAMNWDPPDANHRTLWKYNRQVLTVSFMGFQVVQSDLMGQPFVVSVDGKEVKQGLGAGLIITLHSGQNVAVTNSMYVSWDHNNPGDPFPETKEVFDTLRHGHVLTVKVFGRTYIEDLRGVGPALDLLGKCVAYSYKFN